MAVGIEMVFTDFTLYGFPSPVSDCLCDWDGVPASSPWSMEGNIGESIFVEINWNTYDIGRSRVEDRRRERALMDLIPIPIGPRQ